MPTDPVPENLRWGGILEATSFRCSKVILKAVFLLGVLNTSEDGKLTASLKQTILAWELSTRKSLLMHDPPHLPAAQQLLHSGGWRQWFGSTEDLNSVPSDSYPRPLLMTPVPTRVPRRTGSWEGVVCGPRSFQAHLVLVSTFIDLVLSHCLGRPLLVL